MRKIFPALFVALAVAGCSRYGYVQLNYPTPPAAYLPDDVHSIAIVNRSLASEEAEDEKVFESIATGEVAGSDRLASDECIRGAFDAIKNLEQAEIIIPRQVRLPGTGTRELPELLDWNLAEEICDSSGSDALLVLETFDSNSDILLSAAREQVSAIVRTGSPQPVGPGRVKMNVVCNWRLYDPYRQKIIDQYQHNSYMSFDMREGLLPPHALPETAYAAGVAYIRRYLPGSYVVKRKLYQRTSGRAKHQFRAGFRRTEVANWLGAVEIWDELSDHPKRKTAGRACLNIAVANEVLGNTDTALDWARRSYEFYRNKLGRSYAKILLNRRRLEDYAP